MDTRYDEKIVDFSEKIVTISENSLSGVSFFILQDMSTKKIIFFIILGIVLFSTIFGIYYISSQSQQQEAPTGSIKIWITAGTSEGYQDLIA
jgi:hypothetical protein